MKWFPAARCWKRISLSAVVGIYFLILGISSLSDADQSWSRLLLSWTVIVGSLVSFFWRFVRGYEITENAIVVRGFGWARHYPREDLVSAEYDAEALKGMIVGRWTPKLGDMVYSGTDERFPVVLKFKSQTVVVSPKDVEGFVRELGK
ncbi:MAG: hypothetical protein QM680_06835 [Luteolibacter sp.]